MLRVNSLIGFGSARRSFGNDANTVLLLHCDGADGSTTFTNVGGGASQSFTATGDAQVDTAQSKFGGGSLLLDGTGDYLVAGANSSDFTFTGDFTIDFWSRKSANGSAGFDAVLANDTGSGANWFVELSSSRGFLVLFAGVAISDASHNPNDSTWHHYAAVRSGTNVTLYIDGVSAATGTVSGTITNDGNPVHIGAYTNAGIPFNGHLDEIRVMNGTAFWTAAFTPPTIPYS